MPNQYTKRLTNSEKKVVRPATEISDEALTQAKSASKVNGKKIGDLPDLSQECTGCTTLRLEISKLKDKVSTIEAAKVISDDRSDLLKMVSEATEEIKVQHKLPTAVLENLQAKLEATESDVAKLFAIIRKVHGTTEPDKL